MGKELIVAGIFKRVIGVWVFLKFQSYWWVFVQITLNNKSPLLSNQTSNFIILELGKDTQDIFFIQR